MKEAFPEAPLIIGRNEAILLRDAEANMSAPFGLPIASPEADRLVDDGEQIELAGFPSRCARSPDTAPARWSLFAMSSIPPLSLEATCSSPAPSAGPTWAATCRNCSSGIRAKLFPLPDSTVIYPGHGPATTIGAEKRSNPFVGESATYFHPR